MSLHFWSSRRVTFDLSATTIMTTTTTTSFYHHTFTDSSKEFNNKDDSDSIPNYYQIAIDTRRKEPRFIQIFRNMTSVQNLLGNVSKRRPVTVVFGNLGRLPHLLSYYLDLCFEPNEEIRVLSEFWEETNLDDSYEDDGTYCDVLIMMEPKFGTKIYKPSYAKRLIVLTSHLILQIDDKEEEEKIQIVAHHVGNIHQLPIPIHSFVGNRLDDRQRDFTYDPNLFLKTHIEIPYKCNVCVDLETCRDSTEIYLKLLNACDVLRFSNIERWTVAMKNSLTENFQDEMKKFRLLLEGKYRKIDSNVDGMNSMKRYYVDQFLF